MIDLRKVPENQDLFRLNWRGSTFWAMLVFHIALVFCVATTSVTLPVFLAAVAAFSIRMFCVTAGFHRYFSHRSFSTSRVFQFVLAFIGGMSMMKGALWWASIHRLHHRESETEDDPHSPNHGWLWSHMGWFLCRRFEETRTKLIPDWMKYPELVWLDRNHPLPLFFYLILCHALLGWEGLVWCGVVSTLCVCHAIFMINSVAHTWGQKRYPTKDDSRNSLLVSLLTFGEGWHNNHHYYPASARQGFFWWEVDISYYILKALEWLGIVWDIRVPPRRLLHKGDESP